MAGAMATQAAAVKVAMLGSENHLTLTLSQKKKKALWRELNDRVLWHLEQNCALFRIIYLNLHNWRFPSGLYSCYCLSVSQGWGLNAEPCAYQLRATLQSYVYPLNAC